MAKIIAAAVQYTPLGSSFPCTVAAKRHCDCFEWMFEQRIKYDKETCVQGFLTDHNQFIDRYEAMYLAHDQLLDPAAYKPGSPLYSEDLW